MLPITDRMFWSMRFWGPILFGVLTMLLLVPVVIALAGGGHGLIWPLAMIFPYAVVVARTVDLIGSPAVSTVMGLLAMAMQMPSYAALIGAVRIGRLKWSWVGTTLSAHLVLALAVLLFGDVL